MQVAKKYEGSRTRLDPGRTERSASAKNCTLWSKWTACRAERSCTAGRCIECVRLRSRAEGRRSRRGTER